jgi:hypothetical protein
MFDEQLCDFFSTSISLYCSGLNFKALKIMTATSHEFNLRKFILKIISQLLFHVNNAAFLL